MMMSGYGVGFGLWACLPSAIFERSGCAGGGVPLLPLPPPISGTALPGLKVRDCVWETRQVCAEADTVCGRSGPFLGAAEEIGCCCLKCSASEAVQPPCAPTPADLCVAV
eukprot:173313-Chlamydomonas_euryale.AAC.1